MDLAGLRAKLKESFEDRARGSLVIPAASIPGQEWEAIRTLLEGSCAGQTLTITDIEAFPPDAVTEAIVYQGRATLFPCPPPNPPAGAQATLAVTARFTVDASTEPQLALQAEPLALPWHLGDSIGDLGATILASVSFESARLYLNSADGSDSRYPGMLATGVSFLGTIALREAFSRAGGLLESAESRTVVGRIVVEGTGQPAVDLASIGIGSLGFGDLALGLRASLRSWKETVSGDPTPQWFATAEVVGTFQLSASADPLELRMPLLPGGESLAMTLQGGAQDLKGWGAIDQVAGASGLEKVIPDIVPAAGEVALESLEMALDLGDGEGAPARALTTVDVSLKTADWPVIPNGILTLGELGARITVVFLAEGPQLGGDLYAGFDFVDVLPLRASISIPTLVLTVALDSDVPIELADVLHGLLFKLTRAQFKPPLPGMSLARFEFGTSLRSGGFAMEGAVLSDWEIPLDPSGTLKLARLKLEEIEFQLDYDGAALGVELAAQMSIASAYFYVSASTPGGEQEGWTLGAGLQPQTQISVLDLMKELMFGEQPVPGPNGIPSIVITALEMSVTLDAEGTAQAFQASGAAEASWRPEVLGTTLQLSVAIWVNGEKPASEENVVAADAEWQSEGEVGGSIVLYGLTISVGYYFAEDNTTLTFAVWYGARGIEATVSQQLKDPKKPDQGKDTILTVRLGDLSLGEILEYLISLAVPGESRRLPAPWDLLYEVNFKNLSLVANLTTKDIEVQYALKLNLAFAEFKKIALLYKRVNGEGRVYLRLYGKFLGQDFGGGDGDSSEPLTWDVVNEEAPEVSGKGPTFLDLTYVGVGQHLALSTADTELTTVEKAIEALKASMKPVAGDGNPLTDPGAATLRYDGNGKWLFGLEATLVETVYLAAVFYDPHLYGALLKLEGERAGSLAGLRFELIYRRITAEIGEFSVDLTVPDRYRNWDFGEVSVTLGLIHLDVYTNGNFRVDAGFPHEGDFSSSFSVEVFPFIGRGGFYFAYLTGATSTRVPKADNGVFDPVIEAGVGLSVGFGKDFHKGPLSAGLTVEVFGIFEGVYAPFHPYDASLPKEDYYWFQGTAGIVGKLYGEVDFAILKVSVTVVARAVATLVIEAHEPIQVDLLVEVEAEGRIKILFVTIHFSFSLTIHESFTVGSHTTAPWTVAPPSTAPVAEMLRADPLGPPVAVAAQPELRQQRAQHRPRRLERISEARLRMPALRADPDQRAGAARLRLLGETATPGAGFWEPKAVFGAGAKTARVQLVPVFTVADPASLHPPLEGSEENELQVVLALMAQNTIPPGARSAEEVAEVSTDHLHLAAAGEPACVPLMIEAFLRWAAAAGAGVEGAERISALRLQDLLDDLADASFREKTFAYDNLEEFLAKSLHLEVVGYPPTGSLDPTSASFFPMVPEIATETTVGTTRTRWSFASEPPVSEGYAANLDAYFQQIATEAAANAANDPFNPRPEREAAGASSLDASPSLAKVLFGDYFAVLTRAALQGAIDLLGAYPYPYPRENGKSLARIAAGFDSVELDGAGGESVHLAVTSLSIAEDNRDVELASGVEFAVSKLPYQVRSGQSLKDVAAAAPAQAGTPLTGTEVGEANAAVEGLLRAGEILKIPAYTYTRLENDSDDFLKAFFSVRAAGLGGGDVNAETITWYEQAIAKLNEGVLWAEIAPGQKLKVPTAYRSSTPLATEYPIHPGDTLPRIAATFAKLDAAKAPYTPSPAGGSYQVTEAEHEIAAGETLKTVTEAFPELRLADLVGKNAEAKVLAPLATLTLPDYTAKIAASQTLATLAAAFDLDLASLVSLVERTEGIFKAGSELTVRDVPAASLDALIAKLLASKQANEVAAQLSRFLMHGMRMPEPEDPTFLALTPEQVLAGKFQGPLYSLYELTGQQTGWPDKAKPIAVELSNSGASWLSFVEGTASREGELELGDTVPTLKLDIDQDRFTELPSPALTLGAERPQPMPMFEAHGVHHNLQANIHWQAALRPRLPLGGDPAQPGEPTIWQFTTEMLRLAAGAGPGSTPSYELLSVSLGAPPGSEGAPLKSYAWAVRVPLSLQRVAAEPPPGEQPDPGTPLAGRPWLERVYLVNGADHEGADRLLALWKHLRDNASGEAATQLFLAYPPNATEPNPGGLASDALDEAKTYLLQTNLSTDTREPAATAARLDDGVEPPVYSAPIEPAGAPPTAFVGLLWKASTVNPGGFYLHYSDTGGAGLPDSVFDQNGRGTVDLVCILGSQSGVASGGPLLAFNNAAVVNDNLDASEAQVYAMQAGPNAPEVKVPSVPAGNVGFTMLRSDPGDTDLTGQLYNLLGFELESRGPFTGGNEGLPVGPSPSSESGKWFYHQVFDVSRRAGEASRARQRCSALPQSSEDPYAGVGPTAAADISFAAHDVLGSQGMATDLPDPLSIPFRYADRVIGLSEWPGLVASYTVTAPSGGAPNLEVSLVQQAAGYAPGPEVGTVQALRAASAAALRYKQVFFQLNRPGVSASVSTSLDPASASSPLPLSRARLLSFVSGSYVFADQVAKLNPVEHAVGSGETLKAVSGAYSVTAADLLAANQDLLATQVLSGEVEVPRYVRVPRGTTLAELAAAAQLKAVDLVGRNEGAIVPAGTSLKTPVQTFAAKPGQTLAEMARAAGCTPGQIGAANAATTGLIADGLTLAMHGVQVVTKEATFESLVTVFAELGVTASAADVATAAAEISGIFGSGGSPTYKVESWVVPGGAPTTVNAAIAAKFGTAETFVARNEKTAGVIAEGTLLSSGSETAAVETGMTLREFVARKPGLDMAAFARANPTAALTPTDPTGPKLVVPVLVEPAPLEAVPYAVPAQASLASVADLFGVQVEKISEENQDVGGVFVPGQEVQPSGFNAVTTDAEDSIASLLLKFPASARPALSQLVAAIAPSTSLLRPGAVLICPPPRVPADAASLEALRKRFDVDLELLARVNAGVDGFLLSSATVTVAGTTLTVGAHGTLAGLLARAREEVQADLGFEELVTAIAGAALLVPQAKFLLPPPAVVADAALPATPELACTITQLETEVEIARPAAEVDPTLADTPEIRAARAPVPPLTTPAEAGKPVSYVPFATALAAAYGQRLRVATGPRSDPSAPPRLYVVRFDSPGTAAKAIERVELSSAASYFALPPLCTELVSRPAEIRTYRSGAVEPLPETKTRRTYQGVDVVGWVKEALAAIDLVLSPAYAPGAFSLTRSGEASASFDDLVAAKEALAEEIAKGVRGVLVGTGGDQESAAEALRQRLDVSLVDGFATDAVLQLPTEVEATFAGSAENPPSCADAGGHRLAGKTQVVSRELTPQTTLAALAAPYMVDVAAVARLLGTTPNLLATGTPVEYGGNTWTIAAGDTLMSGVAALHLGSLDALVAALSQQAPLFRAGAAVAIDAYSTTTVAQQTLLAAAERLDSPVGEMAVANQGLAGLLPVGATLFIDGHGHEVTATMTSLGGAAQKLSLPVDALAEEIAQQPLLVGGKVLRAVRWLPSHSLSPGKIDLDNGRGTLDLLLGVEQRSQYRRLLLELDFRLNGLEYGIEELRAAPGYERSDWLRFVTPLEGGDGMVAQIETSVGPLEVPVPLRAYPVPPRLVSQAAGPSYDAEEVKAGATAAEKLRRAKAWTYEAVFEVEEATQDTVHLDVGLNFGPPPQQLVDVNAKDPFEALAEFNANYPQISADLANLLRADDLTPAQAKAAKSAVEALAKIAGNIAANWGQVKPGGGPSPADEESQPEKHYGFRLETRTRSGKGGAQVMDSLVLVPTTDPVVWGPEGEPPEIAYLDEKGEWVTLERSGRPWSGEVIYWFPDRGEVPAFERRSYAVRYLELDPVTNQNARTSVWLTRNEILVDSAPTDERFVYRTPETHFHDPIAPSILRGELIGFGAGGAGSLVGAVKSLFEDLLGSDPAAAATMEKLAIRYGWRLVVPSGDVNPKIDEEDFVLFTPIAFRPQFAYETNVPGEVGEVVEDWLERNPCPLGQVAVISLDLTLFSNASADGERPLVELKRLDYGLV